MHRLLHSKDSDYLYGSHIVFSFPEKRRRNEEEDIRELVCPQRDQEPVYQWRGQNAISRYLRSSLFPLFAHIFASVLCLLSCEARIKCTINDAGRHTSGRWFVVVARRIYRHNKHNLVSRCERHERRLGDEERTTWWKDFNDHRLREWFDCEIWWKIRDWLAFESWGREDTGNLEAISRFFSLWGNRMIRIAGQHLLLWFYIITHPPHHLFPDVNHSCTCKFIHSSFFFTPDQRAMDDVYLSLLCDLLFCRYIRVWWSNDERKHVETFHPLV